MDLSELTIVCITYDRPKFVARLIDYWKKNFYDAKIFILDGSNSRLSQKYLNTINTKSITYIHLKNQSIFKRYCEIKNILNTKYFQLVADDEIFLRSGVENCLNFLNKNNSYTACSGKMILFTPLLNKEVFAFAPYNLYSNENPIISERIKYWLQHSQPNTIYSISRSKNYIKILNEYVKFDENKFSKPENFLEELIEIGLAFQGKTKILDNLMWLRSVENERIGLGEDKDRPEETLFDHNNKEKKIFFDNFIENYLNNLDENFIGKELFSLKDEFYKRLNLIRDSKKKFLKKNFFGRFIFKFIPKKLKKIIRFYFRLNGLEIIKFLENNNKGIIFDREEITEVKKFIINFYNDNFYK